MTDYIEELTENGIKTDHPDITRERYTEIHDKPVYEDQNLVIYMDCSGHELNEWADALDIDRGDLSAEMHEIARQYHSYDDGRGAGDPWAVCDPLVFDSATFD